MIEHPPQKPIPSVEKTRADRWRAFSSSATLLGLLAAFFLFQNFLPQTEGSEINCRLPREAPDRIGLAQIGDERVTAADYEELGRRDFIWDHRSTIPKPDGTFAVLTVSTLDQTLQRSPSGQWEGPALRAESLAWLSPVAPAIDHVECRAPDQPSIATCALAQLRRDRTGRAHCVTDPGFDCALENTYYPTRLDVSDAGTVRNLYCRSVSPFVSKSMAYCDDALTAHGKADYDALGIDQVSSANSDRRVGAWRRHQFKHIYSGHVLDPTFLADMREWLSWLGDAAHRSGLCSAVTLHLNRFDPDGYRQLASLADIVVESDGSSRDRQRDPLLCTPEPTAIDGDEDCAVSKPTGTTRHCAWTQRTAALTALAHDLLPKALVVLEVPCEHGSAMNTAALLWPLANYLLIKGPRTYLGVSAKDQIGSVTKPRALDLRTGPPRTEEAQTDGRLHWREFKNAVVIVNPMQEGNYLYRLGNGTWFSIADGAAHHGLLRIAAGTAMILSREPWTENSIGAVAGNAQNP